MSKESKAKKLDAKIMEDPLFRELYMKYLGTLSVLGKCAGQMHQEDDNFEGIELCRADAEQFLRSRITFYRTCPGSNGFYLEPKG